jgi:beta-N-acetylhexosaminidase
MTPRDLADRSPAESDPPRLSRRQLLHAAALGGMAVALVGCGDASTASASAAPSEPGSSTGPATGGAGPTSQTGPTQAPTATARPTSTATAEPTAAETPRPIPKPTARPTPAPTETPAPTIATTRTPTPSAPTSSATVAPTLRQKIGRLLVVGFNGTTPSASSPVGRAIAAGELGGIILFDRNITSPTQLRALTHGLSALAPHDAPLIVSVDEEGGLVLRLGPRHGYPNVPSEQTVGRGTISQATAVYGAVAATLHSAGVKLNLAPVVDVNVNPSNPAIGALGRSFSASPTAVTSFARASVRAHDAHDVRTTLKHFPGLGSATANTDFAFVDVTKTWHSSELTPYKGLIATHDVDVVMVGNMLNGQIDARYPSSLSKATITTLLRSQLHYAGPVITDDLGAVAISELYSRSYAMNLALNAGADLLLLAAPSNSSTYYHDLVTSIASLVTTGHVPMSRIDASVARVAALRKPL